MRFIKSELDEFDMIGKIEGRGLYEQLGYKVSPNDINPDGSVNYNNADLIATKGDEQILIETEVKRNNGWGCTNKSVTIPQRKSKYIKKGIEYRHIVVKEDRTELIVIRGEVLLKCFDSVGHKSIPTKNRSPTPDDKDYVETEHGCRLVKKFVDRKGIIEEDVFLDIAFKYCSKFKIIVPGKLYKLIKKAELFK